MKAQPSAGLPANPARKGKKARPVVVTIHGELAEKIREAARTMGVRASTFALSCTRSGELLSAPGECEEFIRGLYRDVVEGGAA